MISEREFATVPDGEILVRATPETVSVSGELPIPAGTVADLLWKPALMRHVLWPLITFPDLPEHYDPERGVTVALRLSG